jgi:hypothetical protein
MKKRLAITIGIFLLNVFIGLAGPPENILNAIKTGNADKLSEYFDNNVDLKILEKENIYSKSQATILVKDFFKNYKPTNMDLSHEGGPENARFAICNLNTNQGKFRVYFLFKTINSKSVIQKFRIEKDGQ